MGGFKVKAERIENFFNNQGKGGKRSNPMATAVDVAPRARPNTETAALNTRKPDRLPTKKPDKLHRLSRRLRTKLSRKKRDRLPSRLRRLRSPSPLTNSSSINSHSSCTRP